MGIEFVPVINGFVPRYAVESAALRGAFNAQQRVRAMLQNLLPAAAARAAQARAQPRIFIPLPGKFIPVRDLFFTYFVRKFGRRLSSPQCCGDLRQGWT